MKRSAPIARKTRIKPKKRSASEFARIYGSKERVTFVMALGCVICRSYFQVSARMPAENHHIENGGAGRKAAYTKIVPLCVMHHEQCHHIGRQSFERVYAIDLEAAAAETERLWLAKSLRRAWLAEQEEE